MSKPEAPAPARAAGAPSKRDKGAPQRRYRVMYMLLMQGVIAVVLLMLVWFERANTRSMLLYVATLVVPLGWGYAVWSAWRRDEKARATGAFDNAFAQREGKRSYGIMGATLFAWVALVMAVYLFF